MFFFLFGRFKIIAIILFIVLNLLKEDEKYIETTLTFTEAVRLKEGLDKLIKDYCEHMNKD